MDYFGLRIIESPFLRPVPVIQLREKVPVSDKFRAEMNAWLLEMFGTREYIYFFGDNIVMNPRAVALISNIGG